ncbi:MAG: hypothetical protein V2J51_13450 [Erythrobacter sp.]|jgi:hypothetical protein|nr:hypothetical protein [Erythrobacter sp.]
MTHLAKTFAMPGPSAPAFRFIALFCALAAVPITALDAREATAPVSAVAVSSTLTIAPPASPPPVSSPRFSATPFSLPRVEVAAPLSPKAANLGSAPLVAMQTAAQQGQAQPGGPSVQPPASVSPVPSQIELAKLLWSTIAAVDHANRSGNYSVLRDISAQRFQINFNPARLTEIFSGLRSLDIDLSNALLVPPTYYEAPARVSNDVFRARGVFQLRPIAIGFDIYYQWEQGRWKLFGVDLTPQQMTESQPAPPDSAASPQIQQTPAPRAR